MRQQRDQIPQAWLEMTSEAPGHFCDGTHYILRGPTSCEEMVILIHGMRTYHGCFNRLATMLAENGFLTLQYDLLGRGYTELPADGCYGEMEHVGQLFNLIDKLGLPKRLHLIGHSQGGAIAVMFCSHYWRMVASLTLLAPTGLMSSFPLAIVRHGPLIRAAAKFVQRGKAAREKAWRSDFHTHSNEALSIENEYIADMHSLYDRRPEVFDGFWGALMSFPMSGIQGHISQVGENPDLLVLLLWGEDDKAIPFVPNFERWCDQFTSSHCHFESKIYKNAGHAFYLEKHKEVNQDILGFLLASKSN